MSKHNIRWKVFPRDELPEALLSGSAVGHSTRLLFERHDLKNGKIAAGISDPSLGSSYSPLSVFVVDDESAAETFSWLRVYSPATFPLSQFGRVISAHDWRRFESIDEYGSQAFRPDQWASVVVGEALAQSEADVDLAQLPLSRASACFTMAVARAAAIHRSDEATRACSDRLRVIEGDRRFARRLVTVDDLIPVWSLVNATSVERSSPQDVVELVLHAVEAHLQEPSSPSSLRDYPQLSSDSIEARVLAFQRLSIELTAKTGRRPRNGMPAAIIAAAAFMVGRGTSHAFLLRQTGKLFPASPVWFGLMAALVGLEAWDPDWIHATKSVERQVRAGFEWTDASGFDICWAEFSWLAGTFEGSNVFLELPKLAARAISIEIVPGAACQFRLATDTTGEPDVRAGQSGGERVFELQAALEQFVGLALRTRQLLEDKGAPIQVSLNFEGGGAYSKSSRAKKGRGSADKQ
jgi:hypothetical protein